VLSFGVALPGRYLAKCNVFHSFAPWAQFCQPEKQKSALCQQRELQNFGKELRFEHKPKMPLELP
jgi:hypothetical protein